jgi:hypothetical protein
MVSLNLSCDRTSYRPLTHNPRFWEIQTLRLAKGPCQRLGTGSVKFGRDRQQALAGGGKLLENSIPERRR